MLQNQSSEATMLANPPLLPTTNKKKNEEYHALFEGDESELVEDFSCALQKDILVHGRIYISHSFICFYSNILGWTTNVMVKFTDLVKVEKRNSAFVLPNALMIYTVQHQKYFFGSFVFRDLAYNILVSMWRNAVSGVLVGNDMSYLEDQSDFSLGLSSQNSAVFDSESDFDEDTNATGSMRMRALSDTDLLSPAHAIQQTSGASGSNPDLNRSKSLNRGLNNNGNNNQPMPPNTQVIEPCNADNIIFEMNYSPCTVNYLWDLLYSDESYAENGFIYKFNHESRQVSEWQFTKWVTADDKKQRRKLEYILPLTNPLGPKQCKNFVEEVMDTKDDNHVHLTHSTTTPDVPSGTSFTTVAKICITASGPESAKLRVSSNVLWSKSSFIKGPIENGVLSGIKGHFNALDDALKSKIGGGKPSKSRESTSKAGVRRRKGVRKPINKRGKNASWLDIIQPICTSVYESLNLTRTIILFLLGFNLILFYQIMSTPNKQENTMQEDLKAIRVLLAEISEKLTNKS